MFSFSEIPSLIRKSSTSFLTSPCSWMIVPCSSLSLKQPLQLSAFFRYFTIFLRLKTSGTPSTRVSDFLPDRCWLRIWIRARVIVASSATWDFFRNLGKDLLLTEKCSLGIKLLMNYRRTLRLSHQYHTIILTSASLNHYDQFPLLLLQFRPSCRVFCARTRC